MVDIKPQLQSVRSTVQLHIHPNPGLNVPVLVPIFISPNSSFIWCISNIGLNESVLMSLFNSSNASSRWCISNPGLNEPILVAIFYALNASTHQYTDLIHKDNVGGIPHQYCRAPSFNMTLRWLINLIKVRNRFERQGEKAL